MVTKGNLMLQFVKMSNSKNVIRTGCNLSVSTSVYCTSDKLKSDYMSTLNTASISTTKQIIAMEVENVKLRKDLDQTHMELKAKTAANKSLKAKIIQFYIEIQSVSQERQKLNDILTDMSNRVNAAETSIKWYQSQLHNLEADNKILKSEVYTYQGILIHREHALIDITNNYKQLSADYMALTQKYEEDKQKLKGKFNSIILQNVSNDLNILPMKDECVCLNVSHQLGETVEELYGMKTELRIVNQQLLANEITKESVQNIANQQHTLNLSTEKTIPKCNAEKSKIATLLHKVQSAAFELNSQNNNIRMTLLSSKKEQGQIKDAILLLQSQLCKLITQYRILKCKNVNAAEKLNTMQSTLCENKCLRALLREASNLLLQKLNDEKQKLIHPEQKFSEAEMYEQLFEMKNKAESPLQQCLRQVVMRNRDFREQLKTLNTTFDENIDEGYGDISIISSVFADIPAAVPINPVLLNTASNILLQSKNLLTPIEVGVNTLRTKLEELQFLYAFTK